MKSLYCLLCAVFLCVCSCKSDTNIPLPRFWHDGCANFAEDENGYKHEGRCCEWVSIPKIDLKKNSTFNTQGKYSRYTASSGKNIEDMPISVTGSLSADGKVLELSYTVDNEAQHYQMINSDTPVLCDCQCYFK